MQLGLAGLFFLTDAGAAFKVGTDAVFNAVLDSVEAGAAFLFGGLFSRQVFVAFVLPSIIFFGALSAVLDHWGVIPAVVRVLGWGLHKTLGVSGAESLAAAGNVLAGQTEAPLLVRNYLPRMTDSELMSVMTGGFATVAGGVLVIYYGFGVDAGDLLAASLMSAPAALLLAKLMRPETEVPETAGGAAAQRPAVYHNTFDAAAAGAAEGMRLAINVAAMVVAFLALIALANILLGAAGSATDAVAGRFGYRLLDPAWSLEKGLSYLFRPVAWLLGVGPADRAAVAELLGTKTVVNEFVAYGRMTGALPGAADPAAMAALSPRSRMIAVYALCGFANLGSVGIQIGALAFLAPNRRASVAKLAFRAMVAGTLAAFMTACVAGVLAVPAAG